MQAIRTKYHGPSNVRGSRISATAAAGRVIVEWDDALNYEQNHAAAAQKLCAKLNWSGTLISGGLPDGSKVHVFADRT